MTRGKVLGSVATLAIVAGLAFVIAQVRPKPTIPVDGGMNVHVTNPPEVRLDVTGGPGAVDASLDRWKAQPPFDQHLAAGSITASDFNRLARQAGCPYDVAGEGDTIQAAVRLLVACLGPPAEVHVGTGTDRVVDVTTPRVTISVDGSNTTKLASVSWCTGAYTEEGGTNFGRCTPAVYDGVESPGDGAASSGDGAGAGAGSGAGSAGSCR